MQTLGSTPWRITDGSSVEAIYEQMRNNSWND